MALVADNPNWANCFPNISLSPFFFSFLPQTDLTLQNRKKYVYSKNYIYIFSNWVLPRKAEGLVGMRGKIVEKGKKKKKSPESEDNELALGADLQLNQRNQ